MPTSDPRERFARTYSTQDWMDDFNPCRGAGTKLFFPEHGGASQEKAIAICSKCPNRIPCLNYALDNHIPFGIWGGTTERARQRILRKQRLAS